MFDNAGLRRLLAEHGQNLTLRLHSTENFNVSTLTQSRGTTDYTVRTYLYDFTPNMIDGTSVLQGDRRAVLDSLTSTGITVPEPKANDKILGATGTGDQLLAQDQDELLLQSGNSILSYAVTDDSVNIVAVKKITSAGGLMCYLLHVRE